MRSEGRVAVEQCGADSHHAVVHKMRLHAGAAVDRASIAKIDEIELCHCEGLEPNVGADRGAHRSEVDGYDRRAERGIEQPIPGELFLAGVDQFVTPNEERPQGMFSPSIAAHHEPLHRDRDRRGESTCREKYEGS